MQTRLRQAKRLNWTALLAAILLVAPFVRALWQATQAGETAWLPANSDVLLFGAVVAAVLIGDSLLALATCLAAIGIGSAVFAVAPAARLRLRLRRPSLPEAGVPGR
jgi:hypothetical protein